MAAARARAATDREVLWADLHTGREPAEHLISA